MLIQRVEFIDQLLIVVQAQKLLHLLDLLYLGLLCRDLLLHLLYYALVPHELLLELSGALCRLPLRVRDNRGMQILLREFRPGLHYHVALQTLLQFQKEAGEPFVFRGHLIQGRAVEVSTCFHSVMLTTEQVDFSFSGRHLLL